MVKKKIDEGMSSQNGSQDATQDKDRFIENVNKKEQF